MWRGIAPHRVWVIVVGLQAAVVAAGGTALWAGERDEKRVERIVGDLAIETHERAAKAFLWGASIVLAVAAALLILPSRAAVGIAAATTAGTLVVAALAYGAGKAGGELVYARGGAAAFATAAGPPPSCDSSLFPRDEHHD
jgi:hypothetical protein